MAASRARRSTPGSALRASWSAPRTASLTPPRKRWRGHSPRPSLVQSAFRARQCGTRQNPLAARHRLGREAAKARGAGPLSHRRALHVGLRAGLARARRARLQGEAAQDRHSPDRRHGVPARSDHPAGVLSHPELADRRRASGGGRRRPGADPARQARHAHALAAGRGPRRRDRHHGL